MAKLESNFKNMVISLSTIALVSSFLLSFVYGLTAGPIERARYAKQQSAIREVLPEFDRLAQPIEVNQLNVIRAYKNNVFVGAAVESFSTNAFKGLIRVMVGFDGEGRVYNYVVLEQKETPGLGTKMVDWFKTDRNNQSIINRSPSESNFRIRQDGGNIDGITASTISARAFIEAVVRAYYAFTNSPEDLTAFTGATVAVEAKTDSKTEATKQDEAEPEKQLVVNVQPAPVRNEPAPPARVQVQENIVQDTTPQTDSTSGATAKAEETESVVVEEYKPEDEIETNTGEETEESL